MKLAEQQAAVGAQRRSMVGSGNRSEKIRTYNFKENRVTDHRIRLTLHKLDQVMAGDLDELVSALIGAERAAQLNGGAAADNLTSTRVCTRSPGICHSNDMTP